MSEEFQSLESTLDRLKFAQPSETYSTHGMRIIHEHETKHDLWRPRLLMALCTALLLSVGINAIQLSKSRAIRSQAIQLASRDELQATDVSDTDSVFRFLCLTKTSVALNDSSISGELEGFGEWINFEIVDGYRISISLLPLREWKAIGQFEDGLITVPLEDGDVMQLRNIGLGPSGLQRGGPFSVYGNIQSLASDSAKENTAIDNIVAGVDSRLSPLTQKYFGALLRNGDCG